MLELNNITKIFPGVVALDNVSLCFEPGSIHALVGENGAGKSTLIKIMSGIYQPDAGEITLGGREIKMRGYEDAVKNEICMVGQEIQVIPEFTVAENIVQDTINTFRKHGRLNWRAINEAASAALEMVGLNIGPHTKIGTLTAAQKKMIQIAKAVYLNAKYTLLDEPTASLTRHETEYLFKIVQKLKKQGGSVIFVSHRVEEVIEFCDEVSVLRDGRFVGTLQKDEMVRDSLVKMMIGRVGTDKSLGAVAHSDKTALEVKGLTTYGQFEKICFSLKKGEILGFYGLVGSGRTELVRQIIGVDHFNEGEVLVNGQKAVVTSLIDTLKRYRIGYVSENRKEEGLFLDASVLNNIAVLVWDKIINKFRQINLRREQEAANQMVEKLNIKTPAIFTNVGTLSGGNQQKVSISKWLAAQCDILIIDEPTIGVDVGAKEYIHETIWKLAKEEGKSIIVISSDMREIISLTRHILVFKNCAISGEIFGLSDEEHTYDTVSAMIGDYLA